MKQVTLRTGKQSLCHSRAREAPLHPGALTTVGQPYFEMGRHSPGVISGTRGLIYETLLYINRLDGTIKPWLASSYELASDAKSITFHLRQGVTWLDGQPFTSEDVVFTLKLIQKNPSIDLTDIDATVKDVSAPDPSTVTVTLSKPFNPIVWILGPIGRRAHLRQFWHRRDFQSALAQGTQTKA